ncbi:Rap family tetratricopeptide repeat protein [Bacillus safensis]|uniref:Rap family tetratricopeptide repeat protein n=1 Tax=Bacillus TaxID=1386 RepID=UPI002DBAFD1F|nr:Rap family tetratricopeptide repeat protein [Bacillus safensis]MEC0986404.1 tetratricopeptide repeat protein [Bacillus safensis]
MVGVEKILSSQVGILINDWYRFIRTFSVPDAEILKEQVEREIENMEEDQDLLLYYQLMEFRHRLMLESLEPIEMNQQRPTLPNLLKEIENKQPHVKGTLDYYSNFFRGMHEFHHKNYVTAINFYKIAEEHLKNVPDDIERAEFHYKLADAYYRIDQHFVSLNHLEKAKEMYSTSEFYKAKVVGCNIKFGANMYDLYRLDEAESYYREALSLAQELKEDTARRIIGVIHHNIGLVKKRAGKIETAENEFQNSIQIKEHAETVSGIRTLYMLLWVFYDQGKKDKGNQYFICGINRASLADDQEYIAKLKIIYALFEEYNQLEVKESLDYLESKHLWQDVAELSEKLADYHYQKGNFEMNREYLKKTIKAQQQILKMAEAL